MALDGYEITPSQCPNEISYSVAQPDGSALPESITVSEDGTKLIIKEDTLTATGMYTLKVTGTDPKTGLKGEDWIIQIRVSCAKEIVIVGKEKRTYALHSRTDGHFQAKCAY